MFFPQELDSLLRQNGFDIIAKYGGFDQSPFSSESAHQILVCRKVTDDKEADDVYPQTDRRYRIGIDRTKTRGGAVRPHRPQQELSAAVASVGGWNEVADDTREFRKKALHQFAEDGSIVAGIWHKGAIAGTIGLHSVDAKCMEIGYWIGEEYQGKGLITTACRALISHAFDTWESTAYRSMFNQRTTAARPSQSAWVSHTKAL